MRRLDSRLRGNDGSSAFGFHFKTTKVIPREVAESMLQWMMMRRMDSATTLRSAQNDDFSRRLEQEMG